MFRGKVLSTFVVKNTGRRYNPGDVFVTKDVELRERVIAKELELGYPLVEFEDSDSELDPRLTVVGGGWYELPDGERVRGRDKAVEALAALDAASQSQTPDGDDGAKDEASGGEGTEGGGDRE